MQRRGNQLTHEEIMQLSMVIAAVNQRELELHYDELHSDALLSLLDFVAKCPCQTLELFIEDLDLADADLLYQSARTNPAIREMKLDLGKLLVFMSDRELTDYKAEDIADYFESTLYQNVHTLIIDYTAMNLRQARRISTWIQKSCEREDSCLQNLHIAADLAHEVKNHWQEQLQKCSNVKLTFIGKYLSSVPASLIVEISKDVPAQNLFTADTQEREVGCFNFSECLSSLLTWGWRSLQMREPVVHEERTYRRSYHRKPS